MLVVGVMGFAVWGLSVALGDWLSYVTIAAGLLLRVVGVLLLLGREVSLRLPRPGDGGVRAEVARRARSVSP